MKLTAFTINAFTDEPKGGNPAGLVINPPPLTDQQMQWITKHLKVSETAFLTPSNHADYRLRFFAPDREVDLCGHATIATFYTLAAKGHFKKTDGTILLHQETNVGILPIEITLKNRQPTKVMMIQAPASIKNISYSYQEIASILNIPSDEIDTTLPQQKVSTGLYTLPIKLTSLKTLKKIQPNYQKVKSFCMTHDLGSWHLFTDETKEPTSLYHARNLAPLYGINEDPVTGTANGAVTYFLYHHHLISTQKNICEQGDIIHHPGRVHVDLTDNQIKVGGIAYILNQKEITIPVKP
jgi:PhzF family phenazine biosynthesis protein